MQLVIMESFIKDIRKICLFNYHSPCPLLSTCGLPLLPCRCPHLALDNALWSGIVIAGALNLCCSMLTDLIITTCGSKLRHNQQRVHVSDLCIPTSVKSYYILWHKLYKMNKFTIYMKTSPIESISKTYWNI